MHPWICVRTDMCIHTFTFTTVAEGINRRAHESQIQTYLRHHTYTHVYRHTLCGRSLELPSVLELHTDTHTYIQTHIHTYRHTHIHTDTHTYGHARTQIHTVWLQA